MMRELAEIKILVENYPHIDQDHVKQKRILV